MKWIIAQEEAGPVETTWWSIVDTEAEFVRARAYGKGLAQSLADGLNQAQYVD